MILNNGDLDGKHYLTPTSIQAMTSTQTGTLSDKEGNNGYGFGWSTSVKLHGPPMAGSGGGFGHVGAYSTNMWIDPAHDLIIIYMVQHAGYANKDGGKIWPEFKQAAEDAFGRTGPDAAKN
jgi:CubicO group peptidase (beta-lactamase class C family)